MKTTVAAFLGKLWKTFANFYSNIWSHCTLHASYFFFSGIEFELSSSGLILLKLFEFVI